MSSRKSKSSRQREYDRLNNYLYEQAEKELYWEEYYEEENRDENSLSFHTSKETPVYFNFFNLFRIKVGYRTFKSKEDDYDVDFE